MAAESVNLNWLSKHDFRSLSPLEWSLMALIFTFIGSMSVSSVDSKLYEGKDVLDLFYMLSVVVNILSAT